RMSRRSAAFSAPAAGGSTSLERFFLPPICPRACAWSGWAWKKHNPPAPAGARHAAPAVVFPLHGILAISSPSVPFGVHISLEQLFYACLLATKLIIRTCAVLSFPPLFLLLFFHFRQGSTSALQEVAHWTRRTGTQILIVGLQRQPARQPSQVAQIAKAVCGAANIHDVLELFGAVVGCLPTRSATAQLPSCRKRLFERS